MQRLFVRWGKNLRGHGKGGAKAVPHAHLRQATCRAMQDASKYGHTVTMCARKKYVLARSGGSMNRCNRRPHIGLWSRFNKRLKVTK